MNIITVSICFVFLFISWIARWLYFSEFVSFYIFLNCRLAVVFFPSKSCRDLSGFHRCSYHVKNMDIGNWTTSKWLASIWTALDQRHHNINKFVLKSVNIIKFRRMFSTHRDWVKLNLLRKFLSLRDWHVWWWSFDHNRKSARKMKNIACPSKKTTRKQ